jgi:aldehyde:ferredoxin oxidoreductase
MSQLGGYMGRFLNVNLSTGTLEDERPPESLLRDFIGGYGLGARVLYERMSPGVDPLGPDNMLGLVTGPLTGTAAMLGSRYCAVAKSPLTGGWGDANSGGEFGPALKFAGYDAIFITGVSPEPVYLFIEDGHAELRPADDLWGLDVTETERTLQARHGDNVRVACIGPAGERLALIAAIMNDLARAAGRSGLGAVMGSKRLKAVAVRGNHEPLVVHADRAKTLRKKYLPLFKTGQDAQLMRKYGTPAYLKVLSSIGRTPIKNWRGTYVEALDYDALDGPVVEAYEGKKYACWHCVQACGGHMEWEMEDQVLEGHKPEYETLASLGTYCGVDDLKAVMRMNDMCNRAGLDTISAGSAIAFAMECYENGLLSDAQLDGLTLEWGDGQAAIVLLQRIIDREGLGDLLADGVWRAAHQIGDGSEAFAIHAGGQELPAHDPRHEADFGLVYQISPTPGRHTQGGVGEYAMPDENKEIFGLDTGLEQEDATRFHARAYMTGMAWRNVLNAAGLCHFGAMTMDPGYVPDFIAAVTGWDFDMAECIETGERIEDMRLLFGLREGYNPLEVQVAPRAMGHPPQKEGPTAGAVVEIGEVRDNYLELMAWDPVTAMPSPERLAALGLDKVVHRAKDLT